MRGGDEMTFPSPDEESPQNRTLILKSPNVFSSPRKAEVSATARGQETAQHKKHMTVD